MDTENPSFYGTAKKLWKTVVDTAASDSFELELQLELHKKLLSIFQAGTYYYLIFNMYKGDVEFISAGVTDVLGYQPDQVNAGMLMEKIHPDDKAFFLNFEYKITEFFKALPFDKIKNYKVQYDYRIKASNNKYVRILHQAVQIDYDETNFYRTLCLQTDISHIKQEGVPCFSIIGLEGEPSYYNIKDTDAFKKSYDLFTKREREILKCIIECNRSKQISEKLHISLHTVNTHRKNILSKADCTKPVDLVSKAINEGWI